MRKFLIILMLLLPVFGFSQPLDSIKCIHILSEIQDTMVLLNKPDVDKINKTFHDRDQLDSLNKINEQAIELLQIENVLLDSIIANQEIIIQNNQSIEVNLQNEISKTEDSYKDLLKSERRKKIGWQSCTGISLIAIILILLL